MAAVRCVIRGFWKAINADHWMNFIGGE
ncbi:hypothetical protein Tco_1179631, partial [Tanacetum coccineum]